MEYPARQFVVDRVWIARLFSTLVTHRTIVLLASYIGINVVLVATKVVLGPDVGVDWMLFRQLPTALESSTVYEVTAPGTRFVWSPVAAWLMAGVVSIGYWPWVATHVASVLLLRSPLLIGVVLVSYGFWFDTAQGNTVSLVLIAGMLALGGSRAAALVYLTAMLLMPRPLMLPLAAWLLWRDHALWRPFAAIFVIHAALVLASGMAAPWLASMVSYELSPGITIGPTAWIGRWWLLVGIPLALLLTWRGWFGWAGLAMSPYITPQYVLWPLLDAAAALRRVDAEVFDSHRSWVGGSEGGATKVVDSDDDMRRRQRV